MNDRFWNQILETVKARIGAMIIALHAARGLSKYLRTLAFMESPLKITYQGFCLNLKVAKL